MKSQDIEAPFYSSINIIIWLPLLVFVVAEGMAFIYPGMGVMTEKRIDKIFHVLGGYCISLSIAGVIWHSVRREIIELSDKKLFRVLVFGILCFVVISWEILEYILVFPIYPETLGYIDTITDMIFGLVGGIGAMFFVRKPTL